MVGGPVPRNALVSSAPRLIVVLALYLVAVNPAEMVGRKRYSEDELEDEWIIGGNGEPTVHRGEVVRIPKGCRGEHTPGL